MSRRLRPPKPPVTGHPVVDNGLRRWRKERIIWLDSNCLGIYHWLPRKQKKFGRQNFHRGSFRYHPAAYYIDQLRKEVSQ